MQTLQIPERELTWAFARSGGPGGQNVNKVATKAVLRWDVQGTRCVPEDVRQRLAPHLTRSGELVVSCQSHRSQGQNRQECLAKLHRLLAQAQTVPVERQPTAVPARAQVARLAAKRRRSLQKGYRRRPPAA